MSTFKITLAYDGTDFVGWQRQADGVSVQSVLEDALAEFESGPVAAIAAGRTDAGVHARGQVVSFALAREIAGETLMRALNAKLPGTVRVLDASAAAEGFHARFHAQSKAYRYRIVNRPVLSPFDRRYAWHVPGPLDLEAMTAAARRLEGRHDFAAFQSVGTPVHSTERHVMSAAFSTVDDMLLFDIRADGFLRHMVRAIVGTLVLDVGRGHQSPDWIDRIVTARDRSQAGPSAPPQGLFLMSVEYNRPTCR